MPFRGSRNDEAVDDFDDYDPTPYSGGYDQALTYGRPLPHSDDTCYSVSVAGDVDYERTNYSSNSQNSAYETDDASFGDRYGRPRPKPQSSRSNYDGDEGAGGKYGSEYGSDFGGRPQKQEYGSEYESGYGGGRPKRDEEDADLQGYGREVQHGSGYDSQEGANLYVNKGSVEQDYGGSGFRRSDEEGYVKQSYGGGNFQKSERQSYGGGGYRRSDEEGYVKPYGGGNFQKSDELGYGHQGYGGGEYQRSDEEVYGGGGDYRRNDESEFGVKTHYGRPSYGVDEEGDGRYKKSGYGEDESLTYKKSGYGYDEESSGYEKPSIYGGEDGEGYGRPKFGNKSYDAGENKESYPKHHHHHHQRNYDED